MPGVQTHVHHACILRCRLTAKLLEVCKNPRFAGFNHCLFDAVAALIVTTSGDANTLTSLEDRLFPCFEHVLQQDVQEFQPYVFQIFALLIVKSSELRPAYVDVRPLLIGLQIQPLLCIFRYAFPECARI
jgi:exportin-2 (importin alpha re-exporter)